MMRSSLLSMCWIVAIGTLCSFLPQDDFSECKEELLNCVKKLSAIKAPTDKQVYYLNMTVKTDMNASTKIPDSETRADVYMSAHQLHYVSDVLETYQDETDAFAVLPQRKIIVWASGGKRADADTYMQMITQAQDTLLTLSSVVSCEPLEQDGRKLKVITLAPHQKAREAYKISRLEYHMDIEADRVLKTNTYYAPDQNILMRSITYNTVNFHYDNQKLSKPVYEQIFAGDNKLQVKYKGYQLVDKRN